MIEHEQFQAFDPLLWFDMVLLRITRMVRVRMKQNLTCAPKEGKLRHQLLLGGIVALEPRSIHRFKLPTARRPVVVSPHRARHRPACTSTAKTARMP